MPKKMVKVQCNRDQRWSFGRFKKDQVIEVTEDIGATFVEAGYGDYFGADSVKNDPKTEEAGEDESSEEEEVSEEEVDFRKITKKNDLEAYAKETYGVDLDRRKTIPAMVKELEDAIEEQENAAEVAETEEETETEGDE